uniref:Uncharacterized protein n=1 Tax=Myxococcus fulvus TaxID=33 RepID=A0A3Q8I3K9_MYXFU|nr:hypothetical protein [Myxococcus fulvus]
MSSPRVQAKPHPALTVLLGVLLAFLPKCAMCWAAWASLLGGVGLASGPALDWLFPVLLGLSALHLLLLLRSVPKRGPVPFVLSLAGFAVILGAREQPVPERWVLLLGIALMVGGSLLNGRSVPSRAKPPESDLPSFPTR